MKTIKALLAFTLLLWGVSAQAMPVGAIFSGEITGASRDARFLIGATVRGQARFHGATGVGREVLDYENNDLQMRFRIPSVDGSGINQNFDYGFPFFPTLTLRDGEFRNIDFFGERGDFIWRVRGGNARFRVEDFAGNFVRGRFDVKIIPEPGTLALLGIGLLGFAVARRRA